MRAKLFGLLPLLAVIVTAAYGCASQGTAVVPVEEDSDRFVIRISGAGGTTGVLQGLAEEYSRITKDVPFEFLDGTGSAGGVKGVNADLVDLGAMSRLPKDSELETGMSPEELEKIFDPLYSTKMQGTGLGLAVCQRIISNHVGGLDVASKEGVGTTVTVRFPLINEGQ